MNKQRLSGIVLVVSFIVLGVGSSIFSVPNLWPEGGRDIDERMKLIEDYRSEFNNGQIIFVVSTTGIAVGFLLLTLHLQGDETARLAKLGAASMILGTISLAILMLTGISDPRAFLNRSESTALSIYEQGFTWLTIAGYLLYGIVFLRGGFPRLLAYFTLGFTILVLVATFFIGSFAGEFLLIMPLIIGIVLLRRSKES
jgi:hypothetical protein